MQPEKKHLPRFPFGLLVLSVLIFCTALYTLNYIQEDGSVRETTDTWSQPDKPFTLLGNPPVPALLPLPEKPVEEDPQVPFIDRPEAVRGIFLTGNTVSIDKFFNLIDLVRNTELNAMVIDLKDDNGRLTHNETNIPLALETGAGTGRIKDTLQLMNTLAENDIYPIARVVAFKDKNLAEKRPDLAVQNTRGGIWKDRTGAGWLDPYNIQVWDYLVEITKEAEQMGFREIQFDYVRFPSDGQISTARYPSRREELNHAEVITAFLRYVREQIGDEFKAEISADVFGLVTSTRNGMNIGQVWESIAAEVDVICPMVYPSHYIPGNLGVRDPESQPYDTVYRSLKDGQDRLREAGLEETVIRPWLQFFSLKVKYGPAEVRAQVRAAKELGINEYLLWNAANIYPAHFFPLE